MRDMHAIMRTLRTPSSMETVLMAALVAKQSETRDGRTKTATSAVKPAVATPTKWSRTA